ncbi:MAG: HNH endonuclease [Oligosphaeraceae bacterium]|nr:HNH endonuclease [Oligosphaeraceae bacterium]
MPEELCFVPADEEHVRREREKARQLRASQWWKNLRGQGICYYCQKRIPPKELCMDHLVPVIRGGKSSKGNIVACCKPCNNKKSHLLPVEWQEYLEMLKQQAK